MVNCAFDAVRDFGALALTLVSIATVLSSESLLFMPRKLDLMSPSAADWAISVWRFRAVE